MFTNKFVLKIGFIIIFLRIGNGRLSELMPVKILVCDMFPDKGIKGLSNMGFDVTYNPKMTSEELIATISTYDVLVVRSRTKVTNEVIRNGKNLKIIGRAGVGLDNVDTDSAKKAGIKVLNTPEGPTNVVAELTIGLMLSLARGITKGNEGIKKGEWLKNELIGTELLEKTIGIIGLGRIGKRVAELAKAFGMKILAYDVIKPEDSFLSKLQIEMVDLDHIISESDYITIHVPMTDSTFHFINEQKLKKMKSSTYIINVSRGTIIDEKALLDAITSGTIKGAALDVFEVEPPTSNKLVKLNNVVATPHIGAQTHEGQELSATLLVSKIVAFFKG